MADTKPFASLKSLDYSNSFKSNSEEENGNSEKSSVSGSRDSLLSPHRQAQSSNGSEKRAIHTGGSNKVLTKKIGTGRDHNQPKKSSK